MRLAAALRASLIVLCFTGIRVDADELYARTWGPDVGTELVAFDLSDQMREQRSFADLASDRGLLIVFARSGDW